MRPFRTPFYPITPILGAIMCVVLLMSLMAAAVTRNFFLIYLAVGIVIYFAFGMRNSKLGRGIAVEGHEASPMESVSAPGRLTRRAAQAIVSRSPRRSSRRVATARLRLSAAAAHRDFDGDIAGVGQRRRQARLFAAHQDQGRIRR